MSERISEKLGNRILELIENNQHCMAAELDRFMGPVLATEEELTRAKADCAIKEIAIVDAIHTIYDLFPEVVSQPLINRAQQSLTLLRQAKLLTTAQDFLDARTADQERIAVLDNLWVLTIKRTTLCGSYDGEERVSYSSDVISGTEEQVEEHVCNFNNAFMNQTIINYQKVKGIADLSKLSVLEAE